MKILPRFILALTLTLPILTSGVQAATTLKISSTPINPQSQFQIVFDCAVIADDQIGDEIPNNILTTTPHLPGKIRWKSSNIADFIPTSPPTMGTTYTFNLNKGLTDRDGKEIPSTKLKTVTSEAFNGRY